jgi:hypothetical protein
VVCSEGEAEVITCFNPANGVKFYFDRASEQLIEGSQKDDTDAKENKIVTLTISEVNSKGEVEFEFSEDVNVEAFASTKDTNATRLLRPKASK